jgi:pimeloyl-ACP methyl ester carboxylesterase
MVRRFTILGFVLLLAAGCESGSSRGPEAISFMPAPASSGAGFVALYAPPVHVVPYPNDIYNPTGVQLNVPVRITSPLAQALNTLDGFSTTAVISAPFNAPVAPASLVPFNPLVAPTGTETIFVLDVTNGVPLVPGLHYKVRTSSSAGAAGTVEIVPLMPLAPRTRYAFFVTNGVQSSFGSAASADTIFGAVRDAHLAGLTSVPGAPQLDPLFAVIPPLIDAAVGLLGLPGNSIVSAWTMLTQSVGDVLEVVAADASARPALVVPTGNTTAALGLPGDADIYMGRLEIPYFGDPATPLASVWVNSDFVPPNVVNPAPLVRVPNQRIPLLLTLPNESTGHTKPAEGWPVAIFQHGITLNRTVMLGVADAFARAGFAVLAIDLPLHGITDTANPFYQGPGHPLGNNERHFNLDNVGATGVFVPDGQIDNGWQILNLQNPLNARDHIRQAVSDLLQLTRTIPALAIQGGPAGPVLDGDRIHFVAVSLGSIISGVFLGLAPELVTATLANPAGPWTSILTDPEAVTFGEPIRAGLAAQGLSLGTAGFDQFVRDLQTLVDPVDPTNYAAAAAANQPLHVLAVIGDTTVPNAPTDHIASLWGLPGISTTTGAMPPDTVSGIVRFTAGAHSSLFNPAIDLATTMEMQRQTVIFAASLGSLIDIENENIVE